MAQRNSDSYKRVTIFFYKYKVKDILALSPELLGVPAKTLGAQSNPKKKKKLILDWLWLNSAKEKDNKAQYHYIEAQQLFNMFGQFLRKWSRLFLDFLSIYS